MESPPSLSGRRLGGGRYLVGQCIGAGGMGAVYEAVQEDLRRRVAIKVLRADLAAHPVLVERFRREALAAAGLGHAHIVQVTDFHAATKDDPPFLVMELLAGRSLHRAVRDDWPKKKMSAERLARIAIQILGALDAAHTAGIVHRDIKPDNVFLCETNLGADLVKVLDFGVAKLRDEDKRQRVEGEWSDGDDDDAPPLTAEGMVVGTPAFMAPEQARGEQDVDARADVYGVGGCLFLAATNRPPVIVGRARDFAAIARARVTPLGELRTDLDQRFCAIVDRALHGSRAMRFPSASAMRRALEWWLSGDGPDAVATNPARTSVDDEAPTGDDPDHELAFAPTETMEGVLAAAAADEVAHNAASPDVPDDDGAHTTLGSALALRTLASPGNADDASHSDNDKPNARARSRAIALGGAAVAAVAAIALAFAGPSYPTNLPSTNASLPSESTGAMAPDASSMTDAEVASAPPASVASSRPIASTVTTTTTTTTTATATAVRANEPPPPRPSASAHFDQQSAGEFLAHLAETAKLDCSRLEGPRTQTFLVRFAKSGDVASITPTTSTPLTPAQTCIEQHFQNVHMVSVSGSSEGVTAVSVTLQPLPGAPFN